MKALLWILLFLATSAIAAETPVALNLSATGPDELRVTGPTTGEVGREITLIVRGLPEVNLEQTVNDVLGLFKHVRASASTPGEPIDLDSEIGFTVAPVAYRMKLLFTPQEPGVYVVAVDWNEAPFGLALHRIEIRGPPEPPDPPSPPIPPPSSIQSVMILRESGDQDAPLASTINQLRNNLELSKRIHLVADPDMKNPLDGQPIPLIEAAKKLVGNEPLPRLIGLDSNMAPVGHQAMPVGYSAVVDALKAWGVE